MKKRLENKNNDESKLHHSKKLSIAATDIIRSSRTSPYQLVILSSSLGVHSWTRL